MNTSDAQATATPGADLREAVGRSRRRQRLRWGLAIVATLLLLSFFSAGFFLYAAVVVAGVLILTTGVTAASIMGLEVARSFSESEIELGDVLDARLVLHNRKELPALWLFWRDQVESGLDAEGTSCGFKTLGADDKAELNYRLHSTRRGLFRVGPAVVETSDPFGLVRRFMVDRGAGFVTVLPRSVAIGKGWPLGHRPIHEVPRRHSLFEDPSRFRGIREYRAGDEVRRVHWRATARSGKLQVKLYEPAVLEGLLLAVEMGSTAYPRGNATADHGDPAVELAITAAASLAEFVLAGGQQVGLVSNGTDAAERYPADWTGGSFRRLDEALEEADTRRRITGYRPLEVVPGKGTWQRERLRTALARLVPAPGLSLPELLTMEIPRLPRSLVLLVVTPQVDPELGSALAGLRRSGLELGVVWIGARPGGNAEVAAPEGVPVYPVSGEQDIERLGGFRL
ncbi:MAG: DUF58 domain-containing protein [bacterium]|nr:DUF58 domain-containing protein [bacterium]